MELVRTTAIRRNPASPLIKYALRAWVEVASSLLTKEKGHPKLDVLKQGSHHSAVNPAERFTAESEETSCRTKKPRRRRGFVSNRKFLSRSGQRGSNSLPPPWQGGALPDELCPRNKGYFSKGNPPCQEFVSIFSKFSSGASGVSATLSSSVSSAPSSTNSMSPTGSSAG